MQGKSGRLVVALAVWRQPLQVAGPTPEDRAFALSGELMSPYCPGKTVATCPSPGAKELREEMTRRIAAGESEDQIAESLVLRFGDALRASPEPRGFALMLWIVPGVLGAVLLAYFVRVVGWHQARPADPPADVIDQQLAARLDDELERLG